MSIEIVRGSDADAVLQGEGFRSEWQQLCHRCEWATAFQGPDYVGTWYRIYRDRYDPVLVLSRNREGELDGLITLAANPDETGLIVAGGAQAEYQAWICRREQAETLFCEAVQALAEAFPGGVLTFQYLPPKTPVNWLTKSTIGRDCVLVSQRRPLLLFGDGSDVASSLAKKSNKSRLKRLEKAGPVEFKRITDAKALEAVFDDIVQTYDFRQAAVHDVAPFEEDELKRSFHLALMETPGLLHTTALMVGGQVGAAHLGACGGKEVQLGIITHSPLLAKHSPGKFHILYLAQMLMQEGYERLDLTPGGDSYKDRFANAYDEVHVLTVYLSQSERSRARVRAAAGSVVKSALRTMRIEPKAVRELAHEFRAGGVRSASASMVRRIHEWIRRHREMRIYSLDVARAPDIRMSGPTRCNDLHDLMRYQSTSMELSRQSFLSTALRRLEDGIRVHTYTEGDDLLFCGWLMENPKKAFVSEVGQDFVFTEHSIWIFDFHLLGQVSGQALLTRCLRAMCHDAASSPGAKKIFIAVRADDIDSRRAIEETGFGYTCSLFEKVRLGQVRRWSHPAATSESGAVIHEA